MTINLDFIISWVGMVIWPFVRIGAMFMAAPVFGAKSVPVRVRIALALVISLMIAPLLPALPDVQPVSLAGLLVTLNQVVIGVAMGFLMQLVFAAAVLMGQSVAMTMGLGFASAIDPQNGVSVPVVSQFFLILATLLFLALDGHLVMLASLVRSFEVMPISMSVLPENVYFSIVSWAGYVFAMSLLMALPVMVAVLLINFSFGVMTRAAPQLNIFAVGFPVTLLAGFILMLLSLGVFESQSQVLFSEGLGLLTALFAGGGI